MSFLISFMGVILSNYWSSLNVKIKNKSTNKNVSLTFNFHFFFFRWYDIGESRESYFSHVNCLKQSLQMFLVFLIGMKIHISLLSDPERDQIIFLNDCWKSQGNMKRSRKWHSLLMIMVSHSVFQEVVTRLLREK